MRKKVKAVALVLLAFIAIQFYQPALNIDEGQAAAHGFLQSYPVPVPVAGIIQTSCYDCHSNHTHYEWYHYIQPARSYMENHIRTGKQELNFNEWDNYSKRKRQRLLESMRTQIETRQMPLASYTLVHQHAKLSDEQIRTVTNWLELQIKNND